MYSTGNVLLHEFAHLLWGLGDEYPMPDRGQSFFYIGGTSPINPSNYVAVPVRCSEGVKGRYRLDRKYVSSENCSKDPNTGLPEKNCEWSPLRAGQPATASMMYALMDNVS